MNDPYPDNINPLDEGPLAAPLVSVTTDQPLVAAINRLAQAIEANTVALRPAITVNPTTPQLAPLPPVQTVQSKPACPYHGPDKVAPSTNGKGGFYCQSKASPGQPANPKGYCTWHT